MENRPFDQVFGCMAGEGVLADGATGILSSRTLQKDPANASVGVVNVTCGTGAYVCHGGGYSPWSPKFKGNGSGGHFYPYAKQGDEFSYKNGAHDNDAIHMFSGSQLPIKREIAREFGVFNKYYASVPSYSTPNHLFIQGATSCGISSNGGYKASVCGNGTGRNSSAALFPMRTIFDSMADTHGPGSFSFFINATHPHGSPNDSLPVYGPDTMMAGVARYHQRYTTYSEFFQRAAAGTLPKLSWVLPTW